MARLLSDAVADVERTEFGDSSALLTFVSIKCHERSDPYRVVGNCLIWQQR